IKAFKKHHPHVGHAVRINRGKSESVGVVGFGALGVFQPFGKKRVWLGAFRKIFRYGFGNHCPAHYSRPLRGTCRCSVSQRKNIATDTRLWLAWARPWPSLPLPHAYMAAGQECKVFSPAALIRC